MWIRPSGRACGLKPRPTADTTASVFLNIVAGETGLSELFGPEMAEEEPLQTKAKLVRKAKGKPKAAAKPVRSVEKPKSSKGRKKSPHKKERTKIVLSVG
jgi:hypothetical protein